MICGGMPICASGNNAIFIIVGSSSGFAARTNSKNDVPSFVFVWMMSGFSLINAQIVSLLESVFLTWALKIAI